jgi:REP element-mobilizing transposase RayT
MKRQYERHLPHQIPDGSPIFLTWNLKAAFPKEVVERLRQERARLSQQPVRPGELPRDRKIREGKIVFLLADRYLDSSRHGPLHLKKRTAAHLVESAILFGSVERYALYAWCVMANHVHVLVTPRWQLRKITQGIKGYTARQINALDGQRGRTFWQDESFDHWARDEDELMRIIEYIENNPVAAGLCRQPDDWRWSSARYRTTWPAGTVYLGEALQPDETRSESTKD